MTTQYTPLDEDCTDDSLQLAVHNGGDDEAESSPSRSYNNMKKSNGASSSNGNSSLSEPLTTTADIENGKNGAHDDDDPFYVFREDLYRKLELVDEGLARYLRVVHQTDTSVNTHDLKDAKKQLKRHIKNAESTLKDVDTTVQLVSNQRDKFSNIDNAELFDRKTLVQTSRDRLLSAKHDIISEAVKTKLMADERAKALRRMGPSLQSSSANNNNPAEQENSSFIADSQAKASLLMQQQDETLDELDEAVVRVGEMAGNIHEELGEQNKMLREMEDDLADAEEKLGLVMGKLAKMLKTKDKCQLGTILGLSLTVLVLFFLVIYT